MVLNDGFAVQKLVRADSLTGRFAVWLEHRRTPRCFLIGGCYLVLTFAGSGSHISGTFWLLLYYIQMAFCAGLLGWSLRALMSATAEGGRDATA